MTGGASEAGPGGAAPAGPPDTETGPGGSAPAGPPGTEAGPGGSAPAGPPGTEAGPGRAAPAGPPGTEAVTRFRPKLRYELIGCGLHGHELVGTDAARLDPPDPLIVRDEGDVRWHRCLRCDSWLPLPPPEHPGRERIPSREEIDLPLRGRPLRDRYVLRFIAVERLLHVLVLAAITAAIFLFAGDRARLKGDYSRILANLQGALGGPINNTSHGIFSELNRLFALSEAELYAAGVAAAVYTAVLALETVGLWFAKRWAEYLTLVETGILVPIEVYEMVSRYSALKIITLVLNLAVVAYLLFSKRLFGLRGGGAAEERERQRDTGWQALQRATPWLVGGASPGPEDPEESAVPRRPGVSYMAAVQRNR